MNLKILMFLALAITLLVPMGLADVGISEDQATSFSYNYQELDDEIDDVVSISFDVEIENTGVDNETVTLELTSNDADYTIEFADADDSNFELEASATRTVILNIAVDASDLKDQGDYLDVFDLDITVGSELPSTVSFDAEVESMFEVIEMFFYIDDDEEGSMDIDDSGDDNSDVDLKPGDEVTLYFNIENLFDKDFNDGDLDFDITVELDDRDFGDDINEDVSFNIDASKDIDEQDEDISIQFNVPIDAEEGDDYELIILFEAQDDSGAEYSVEWVANLNVEREDEDVRIDDMSIYPEIVQCGGSFGLTIDVTNYGSDKQNDMFLAVDGDELGIDDDASFSLGYGYDEDENEETLSFQFFIDEDQAEGEYDITVRTYYNDGDDLADSDQITVEVSCLVEEVVEDDSEAEVIVETISFDDDDSTESSADTTDTDDSSSGSEKVSTVEKSYTSSDVELGLTVALIILVVLAILALLLVGFRKK